MGRNEERAKEIKQWLNEYSNKHLEGLRHLKKMQRINVKFFSSIPLSILDSAELSKEEKQFLISAMSLCTNEGCVVGAKHEEAINKAKKYVDKYGRCEKWEDSLYYKALYNSVKDWGVI